MIYVIKSTGKGRDSCADRFQFLTFLSQREAEKHINANTQKCSDGHKYWTRFDIVEA